VMRINGKLLLQDFQSPWNHQENNKTME